MSMEKLSSEEKFKKGERVTWLGIIGNILLTIFKFFAGIVGHSQAMFADGAESLSDILATIVVLISLRVSRKPRDAEHQFGHGKAESLATAIVGMIVIIAGLYVLITSSRLLIGGKTRVPETIALVAAVVTIVIKEIMYRIVSVVAKNLNSSVIMANAWDYRKDAISSVVTFFGIAGARLGFPILDPLVAALVSFIIIKIGYDILHTATKELMDTIPDNPTSEQIIAVAEECKGVEHAVARARRMGQYVYVDMKIDINPDFTIS
ncbi:MAG TPA: cation transporter, partial [Actinobacteria bacterium]|nr:cation transporter [Actinomycetes bacterium]HEX21593.1 cation transporter [Actinomycetota bacterium]